MSTSDKSDDSRDRPTPKTRARAAREDRLKAALRANLRRRKGAAERPSGEGGDQSDD